MVHIYRAENIGSLQRPSYLVEAIQRRKAGTISAAEFVRIEDRAVDEAIALQEQLGLDVITDGEQRRVHFREWLTLAIDGLSPIPAPAVTLRGMPGHADVKRSDPLTVTGKLRFRRSVAAEEFAYARGKAKKPLKITLPHPMTYVLMYGPESREAYPDPFVLFEDAAQLLRQECRNLAAIGCEYIQIDAPIMTLPLDPQFRDEYFPKLGISPDRFLSEAARLMDVVADVPGVQFAAHLCRGNSPTHYFSGGAYDRAAKVLFQGAKRIDTFLLEYDDWRSGSFEALKDVPHDKVVVLGLVSSMKNPIIEPVEDLVARVEDASKYFPRKQLALSAQCGFCSMVGLEGFDSSIQRAKLQHVVAAARRIWN
jgi:5-methyltetrahydropteroyltriglutamate--homocysteine methyltransferase